MEHLYTYQYYGTREGLMQVQIFKSFQDSHGYLWFSTNEGISRFDGKDFVNYDYEQLHFSSRTTYINQFEEAVFFVTPNVISFIYPNQTIESYPFPDNYICWDGRSGLIRSRDNLYLFNCVANQEDKLTNNSLFKFNLKTKMFHKLEGKEQPYLLAQKVGDKIITLEYEEDESQTFTVFEEDKSGLIVLWRKKMKEELLGMIPCQSNDHFFFTKSFKNSLKKEIYACSLQGDSLTYSYLSEYYATQTYIITDLGDNRFFLGGIMSPQLLDNGVMCPLLMDSLYINYASLDKDSNLWLSTEEGVFNYHNLLFESYRPGIKRNDNIWNVHKDKQENIWFTCYEQGIWKANKNGNLQKIGLKDQNYYAGYMSSCADNSGRIYLIHNNGIAVFDEQKTSLLKNTRTGPSVFVYYDSLTNTVFCGGEENLVRTLNQIDDQLNVSTFTFGKGHIISIIRDKAGKLRVGTFRGDYYFDEDTKEFTEIPGEKPYRTVVCMDLDSRGNLWKGGMEGLFVETETGMNTPIFECSTNFVRCYRDKYIIWGSKDILYIMDLPAFYKDRSVRIKQFGYHQGFDVLECGQNGIQIDHEGYVWVAGGNRAVKFHPDKLMNIPDPHLYTPYIAAIYSRDKDTDWLLQKSDAIVLENKENSLQFDILQACVTAPDKLIFRYRLNGYSKHWETSRERSFIFQNLNFGKYQLEVQSSLNGVDWSESAYSPPITIKNPFFLTLPGILLLFLITVFILVSIIYWVRKISIRKQEEKRQIDQLKYRAVQSKFIPHFTGNVLNSINYLISKDPEVAQKYIVDFSGFTGLSLRNSDRLVRTLEEELDYAELYLKLEKLRFEEKLEYSISVEPDVDLNKLIPTMILQTFCENALKHGLRHKEETGIVSIRARKKESYTTISVEDNGIGREKAKTMKTEGSGEGLKIVEQQLAIFNKKNKEKAFIEAIDLFDENNQSTGTCFKLHIPKDYVF